jgi:hypothetical protein
VDQIVYAFTCRANGWVQTRKLSSGKMGKIHKRIMYIMASEEEFRDNRALVWGGYGDVIFLENWEY